MKENRPAKEKEVPVLQFSGTRSDTSIDGGGAGGDDGDHRAHATEGRNNRNDEAEPEGLPDEEDTFFAQSISQSDGPGAFPVPGIFSNVDNNGGDDVENASPEARTIEQTDSALLLEATLVQEVGTNVDGSSSRMDDPDAIITATKVSSKPWSYFLAAVVAFVIIASVLAATLATAILNGNATNTSSKGREVNDPTLTMRPTLPPTLEAIRDRGYIRCIAHGEVHNYSENCGHYCGLVSGIHHKPTDKCSVENYPYSVPCSVYSHNSVCLSQCKALSAAIFNGDASRTEFQQVGYSVPEMLQAIANGTMDVVTAEFTYNMVRDVYVGRRV